MVPSICYMWYYISSRLVNSEVGCKFVTFQGLGAKYFLKMFLISELLSRVSNIQTAISRGTPNTMVVKLFLGCPNQVQFIHN